MPEFTTQATIRKDLDEFTRAYVECALWLMTDEDGESIDLFDGELDDSAYDRIIEDCSAFQSSNYLNLRAAVDAGMSDAQLGHDFWLTRNRHGAGFWDRGLKVIGQELTDAAHPYGECSLYVGDDGKAYIG